MTANMLKLGFKVYYDEIARCEFNKCYWSLLHVVLALPDVCSALETDDPKTKSGKRYVKWCDRYLKTPALTGEEWYEIRCAILHQGHTLSSGRYNKYVFGQPAPDGSKDHGRVDSTKLHLDVSELAHQVKGAMELWFDDVSKDPKLASEVERRRRMLVWEEHLATGIPILRTDLASSTLSAPPIGPFPTSGKPSSPYQADKNGACDFSGPMLP